MDFFLLIIMFLVGLFGMFLGLRSFKFPLVLTKNEVSLGYIVKKSFFAGGSGTFLFFSIILAMGFIDAPYVWTFKNFFGALFFSLFPGGIITLGTFGWSIRIVGYEVLFDFLRQRGKQ